MKGASTKVVVGAGLLVVVVLIAVLSTFASDRPDALERVASDQQLTGKNRFSAPSFLPDDDRAAGLVGALVVLVLASGATYALRRRTPR